MPRRLLEKRRIPLDEADVTIEGRTYRVAGELARYIDDLYQEARSIHTRVSKRSTIGDWDIEPPVIDYQ